MKNSIVIVALKYSNELLDYYYRIRSNNDLIIISPEFPDLENLELRYPDIILIQDHEILDIKKYPIISETKRPNWYYQQFLKYQAVLKLNYDYVHIIDGDSFLKLDLLLKPSNIYYTSKKIEPKYNNFIKEIFPKTHLSDRNYITNQFCFSKSSLEELIKSISKKEGDWINIICKILIKKPDCWFSEYQLYSNFIQFRQERVVNEKKIKVFRRLDLVEKSIEIGLKKYGLVAYEANHKSGILRQLRAHLYFIMGINLG